jgi:hypothetical protein
MKKANTKIGDIFSVKLDGSGKKYFQLIAFDLRQLNSDVIRVFKKVYLPDDKPNLSQIISDEVEFYAHCVTRVGLKLDLWEKIGNLEEVGNLTQILFKDTDDYGSKPGEQIAVSKKWYVWRINDQDFKFVGELKGNNRLAEIGVVINPLQIVERIKTGKYSFVYPGFE